MSELKATTIHDAYWKATNNGDNSIPVYLKSEADKVIAELKKACNDKDDWCLHTLKENRHHKYKRCLDQVENCRTSSVYFFRISEGEKDEGKAAEYRRVSDWFDKWEERWLELAKKFKEAK